MWLFPFARLRADIDLARDDARTDNIGLFSNRAAHMKSYLISYFVALVIFTGVDFVWLGRMGDAFYRPVMGDMVAEAFRPAPAVAFYLLYALGLVIFAISPALAAGKWETAALYGALLGLFSYGTYDLTNQAILKNWSTALSLVDMGWGALLSAFAATCTYYLVSTFVRSV